MPIVADAARRRAHKRIVTTLRPSTEAECADILRGASEGGRTVRVRGGGTKDHLGELLPTEVVMETRGLEGLVDHVPADLTVTARAGTRLRDLQRSLGERSQFLPLDPPHEEATLGGIIGANSNGFGTLRYGGVRDRLIGTRVALVDGSVVRTGGRVVKNVAGYDLGKLLIGSFGTLGVVVEATFSVLPLPQARAASVADTDPAAAFAHADAIVRTSLRPTALVVEGTPSGWRLVVAAAGDGPLVERAMREAPGEPVADVDALLRPLRELPADGGAVVRVTLPLAAQRAFAEASARVEGFTRIVADAGSGTARVHLQGDDAAVIASAAQLMAAARIVGGAARAERRAPTLVARLPAWSDVPPAGGFLMRRIKDAFDPRGVLEPRRSIVDVARSAA